MSPLHTHLAVCVAAAALTAHTTIEAISTTDQGDMTVQSKASPEPEWLATETMRSRSELLEKIFFYVATNRGADAVDVAEALGISLEESVELTEDLLQKGLLDFA